MLLNASKGTQQPAIKTMSRRLYPKMNPGLRACLLACCKNHVLDAPVALSGAMKINDFFTTVCLN